jgi:inactivated superfamily I helicase
LVRMWAPDKQDEFQLKLQEDSLPRTATGKLVRIGAICNDSAGWELAASQLQSRILNIVEAETIPEDGPRYLAGYVIRSWYVLEKNDEGTYVEYAEATGEQGARRMVNLLNAEEAKQ